MGSERTESIEIVESGRDAEAGAAVNDVIKGDGNLGVVEEVGVEGEEVDEFLVVVARPF